MDFTQNLDARSFLESAGGATKITEKLTTTLTAETMLGEDGSYCHITIQGPEKLGPGIFTAEMSPGDVRNFEKHNAIYIRLKDSGGQHAIALLRNTKTNFCELHDPNGAFGNAFPSTFVKELLKALSRGLLRPLISPEPSSPSMPYAISTAYMNGETGVQSLERLHTTQALEYLKEHRSTLKDTPEKTRVNLFEYLSENTHGFCATWTCFKIIDNVKTNLALFSLVNNAMQGEEDMTEDYYTFMKEAQNLWKATFFKELGFKRKSDIREILFKKMMFSIFVRKLASYFLSLMNKNINLDSTHDDWWLPKYNPDDSRYEYFQKFLRLISNEGSGRNVLDFTKVEQKRSVNVIDSIVFEQSLPGRFEYAFAPQTFEYFPFGEPDPTSFPSRNKMWKCQVDTSKPIEQKLELSSRDLTALSPRKSRV